MKIPYFLRSLMALEKGASLRSFDMAPDVGRIGHDCFYECDYFNDQPKIVSLESLTRVLGDRSLDDALKEFEVRASSSLFRIDVEDGGVQLEFAGWISIPDGEEDVYLTLVR
jgi:hypothetical protein